MAAADTSVDPYDVDREIEDLLDPEAATRRRAATTPAPPPATTPATATPAPTAEPTTTPATATPATTPALPATTATPNATAYDANAPTPSGQEEDRGGGGPPINPTDPTTIRNQRRAEVNNYYQKFWGRPAADWEQDYWADQQNLSLKDIEDTLRNAPEATSNRNNPSATTFSRDTDWSKPGMVEAYFKSRNVTPRSTSADYWRQKWEEWGKRDPAYFFERLAAAEEFTGGGGGGGTPASTPTATPTTAAPATDPAITAAIEALLRRGTQPVSGNDPAIRAQFNPQAEVIARNTARQKANLAERAFAQGQYSQSSTNVGNTMLDQAQGLEQATLMGELVRSELAARRQDVVNAITFAQGDQKLKLEAYLKQLDNALRQAELDQRRREAAEADARYYADLEYRGRNDAANRNAR